MRWTYSTRPVPQLQLENGIRRSAAQEQHGGGSVELHELRLAQRPSDRSPGSAPWALVAADREKEPARRLSTPLPPERPGPQCYHGEGDHNGDRLGVLPGDREILVEWLLHEVADCAVHDERGGAWWLPPLAESGGPAGPSPRRALAYGLGARHPQDRLASVDALLVPAARGEPAGPVVGEEPAGPVVSDEVKVDRPADSVRTAAATGAYATVRSVPSAALPALLPTGGPVDGRPGRARGAAGGGRRPRGALWRDRGDIRPAGAGRARRYITGGGAGRSAAGGVAPTASGRVAPTAVGHDGCRGRRVLGRLR
ncbi:hypothetical protein [Streptomyces sp. NPDC088554]|uniref:hypothetical protein n=1 Tax=Streptomyces sp. NPDC088554 TaxID=3365865 RepID=UPI0038304514